VQASKGPAIVVWVLLLGGVGFSFGFFGPMVLWPESMMGPMIGVLLTGPGGALAGLLLGGVFRNLASPAAAQWRALGLAALALAVLALYLSLPEPAFENYVLEATVESCEPATAALDDAVEEWRQEVARTTWAHAAPDWQEHGVRNVQQDDGLLLRLYVHRRSAIFRHRRPWDRGRLSAGAWTAADWRARYYAPASAGSCESHLQRGVARYWPVIDESYNMNLPTTIWPPQDVVRFLHLQEIAPVPPEIVAVLP